MESVGRVTQMHLRLGTTYLDSSPSNQGRLHVLCSRCCVFCTKNIRGRANVGGGGGGGGWRLGEGL